MQGWVVTCDLRPHMRLINRTHDFYTLSNLHSHSCDPLQHNAGGAPPLEAKPGERRLRRVITWTGQDGQQYTRELIITDKTGEREMCVRWFT